MITYEEIRKNEEINLLIERGNTVLKDLGYTEHSRKHAGLVAQRAGEILERMGYEERSVQLAQIAGYLHDIGNCINRNDHAHSGAILSYSILKGLQMPVEDVLTVATAIGHHDEKTGGAVDPVSAALILADKTDVRRNRVQNAIPASFDIHDRVNYAALKIDHTYREDKKIYQVDLELDDSMCTVMDYFEIFLERMLMCRRAAEKLGWTFKFTANGNKLC